MSQRRNAIGEIIKEDPAVNPFGSFIGAAGSARLRCRGTVLCSAQTVFRAFQRKQTRSFAGFVQKRTLFREITTYLQSIQNIQIERASEATQYRYTLQDTNLAELNAWAPSRYSTR